MTNPHSHQITRRTLLKGIGSGYVLFRQRPNLLVGGGHKLLQIRCVDRVMWRELQRGAG